MMLDKPSVSSSSAAAAVAWKPPPPIASYAAQSSARLAAPSATDVDQTRHSSLSFESLPSDVTVDVVIVDDNSAQPFRVRADVIITH